MSVFDDMARDAGYTGDEAAQVARRLEEDEMAAASTLEDGCGGCGGSRLAADGGPCRLCGHERSVLERVAVPGRPGADYEVLLGEVARLRGVVTDLRDRLCVIGSPNRLTYATYRQTFALVDEARDFARAALAIDAVNCAPVESAARAVAPWCADHVRESEGSRQPKDGAA